MNWVRNNRFLAGFLAVVIVVGGVLTYLLIASLSHYSEVSTQYDSQVAELKRLQGLPLFPNDANLKKYEEVRKDYQVAVNDLQGKLAALEPAPPATPLTPLQFQDRLRQVVEETVSHAQAAGVGLPEGFYLGFEQYRGAPPDTAATALLTSNLTAIQNLVDLLINQHIEKITSIKRTPLPQESGLSAAPTPAAGKPGPANAAANTAPLVSKYPVEIAFTTLPSSFRESLNKITADKTLYIVRALQVKNQMDKGPSRNEGVVPGAPAAAGAAPAPGTAPAAAGSGVDANGVPVPALPTNAPPPLRYVVGQERLDVTARIELAIVKPPAVKS